MSFKNHTTVSGFILLGFSEFHDLNHLLFTVLLFLYILTLMANTLIIVTINADHTLHGPLYFFLTHLSSLEVCYVSVIIPKMLENMLVEKMRISFEGCAMQMFFFLFLSVTESFLLATMAFDRYMAICNPLHYMAIMSRTVCGRLVIGSYACGTLVGLVHTIVTFSSSFCGLIIKHFFCEIQPLLELLCGDTFLNEVQVIVVAVFAIMLPFFLVILSYICIVFTILKIPSTKGQFKAFSICSSHLAVVTLFYGTGSFTYSQSKSNYSQPIDKLFSLSYTIVTPFLNPMIYSLRNEEVKGAIRKMWRKMLCA